LKEEEWRVYACGDLGQRGKKRSPWQVGPMRQREKKRERVTVRGKGLLGCGPLRWLGWFGSPRPFYIFFVFFFFFFIFSFETKIFEFYFEFKWEPRFSKIFFVQMEPKK
jgi:hypothetical protein